MHWSRVMGEPKLASDKVYHVGDLKLIPPNELWVFTTEGWVKVESYGNKEEEDLPLEVLDEMQTL